MTKSISHGFSLIELLITIAIVGILSSIAIPSYKSYLIKARRSEAKTVLLQTQASFEQFYSQNNKYTGAPFATTPPAATTYYTYATTVTATTYTITATAVAGSSQASDTPCTTPTPITINETGAQTPTACWS